MQSEVKRVFQSCGSSPRNHSLRCCDFVIFFDLFVFSFGCERQAGVSVVSRLFHKRAQVSVALMFLPVVPDVKLLPVPFARRAEDVRRKARFHALATGLALDNGALGALRREKKKADHTPHDHTCWEARVCPVAKTL